MLRCFRKRTWQHVRLVTKDLKWDFPPESVRNFSIIAHVDHGKSTLADRILEDCGTRVDRKQTLDTLDVERERGITVKSVAASVTHEYEGKRYLLNLIDTPGHVDFNWEVQRSLTACEGVILVVDASQGKRFQLYKKGVQAQTLTNFFLAFELDLVVIPVLNKVDLPHAEVERVSEELELMFDLPAESCIQISAKTGLNVKAVLDAVIRDIPPPPIRPYPGYWCFDASVGSHGYRINFIKNFGNTALLPSAKVKVMDSDNTILIREVGRCLPEQDPDPEGIHPGQIGYFLTTKTNAKLTAQILLDPQTDPQVVRNDDQLTFDRLGIMAPSVFASFFPDTEDRGKLLKFEKSVDSLILNDPAVTTVRTVSPAFGSGLRLGFLGQLHLEVFTQRLLTEFDTDVICTLPTVKFRAQLSTLKQKNLESIRHGRKQVDPSNIGLFEFEVAQDFIGSEFVDEYLEMYSELTVIAPSKYYNTLNEELTTRRRAEFVSASDMGEGRQILKYILPHAETIRDLHGVVKGLTSGFGSYELEERDWRAADLGVLSICVNGKLIPELQMIVQRDQSDDLGRKMAKTFAQSLPMQDHRAAISAHFTSSPKFSTGQFGKGFGTSYANYRREDTTKSKAGKQIDLQRRQKKIIAEKDRLKKLREIGNVKIPKDTITNIFRII